MFIEGDVIESDGRIIGHHKGVAHFTIGQRRGLGIAAGKPIYVTQLNVESNTVTVGEGDALLSHSLIADRANFLMNTPDGPFRADVKIRYLHKASPATVEVLSDSSCAVVPRRLRRSGHVPPAAQEGDVKSHGVRVRVVFDEPQRAITPGQAVVFYDGDAVIGGAWIDRVEIKEPVSAAVSSIGETI